MRAKVGGSNRVAAFVVAAIALFSAPAARATVSFSFAFGQNVGGSGVSTCTISCQAGTSGAAAGQMNSPISIAVAGGKVYVAEQSSARIDVFDAATGAFVLGFGKNVNSGAGDPDVCTTSCQAGTSDASAGAIGLALGVATDGQEVFVADTGNERVDVFTTAGVFERAIGKNVDGADGETCTSPCQRSTRGDGPGEFNNVRSVTVSGDELYVVEQGNYRISVFTKAGVFERAIGLNVDGSGGETCTNPCQAGTNTSVDGAFVNPIAVLITGTHMIVMDDQLSVLTTAGVFERRFGTGNWGRAAVSGSALFVPTSEDRVDIYDWTTGTVSGGFGRDVGGSGVDTCTSSCQPGTSGDGAGQFNDERDVALDSAGTLYAADYGNHRVSVFTSAVSTTNPSPSSLTFGSVGSPVPVGTVSASQSVVLTNNGSAALTISGFSFTGTNADDFLISSDTCGGSLAVGASCSVSVRMAPQATGSRSATLTALTDGALDPTVALSGTGGSSGGGGSGGSSNTILNGTGAPSSGLGSDGDFYIDTAANRLYGPKTSGSWGSGVPLVGPAGPTGSAGQAGSAGATGATGPAGATGPTGPTGADGKSILSGTGAPSAGLGSDGDYYLDTAASRLYGPKTSGAWGSGVVLIGPTGATGPAGAKGDKGDTGAKGATGAAGAKGDKGDAGPQGPAGKSSRCVVLKTASGKQKIKCTQIGTSRAVISTRLSRGRTVYASGRGTTLRARRTIRPGRYVLTVVTAQHGQRVVSRRKVTI